MLEAATLKRRTSRGFFQLVTRELDSPRIASWNGASFDLAVIRYRSLLHGVAAPSFYRTDGERRWNNYQNRYHDLHIDVMDVLSSYGGAMRAGLGTMSALLGIPNKSFLDRPIYDHVLDGDALHVTEYCKLDTVDTMLLLLAWAHHVGHATHEQIVRGTDTIIGAIAREPFEGWREVERGLARWPVWARGARHRSAVPVPASAWPRCRDGRAV